MGLDTSPPASALAAGAETRPPGIQAEIDRIEAEMGAQNARVQDIVRRKDFAAMPAAQQILRQCAIELASLRRRRQ